MAIQIGSLLDPSRLVLFDDNDNIQPAPELSVPRTVVFQPAPELSTPSLVAFQPAPPLSTPTEIAFEPAPDLGTPRAPAFQPAPPLDTPAVVAFEPAPPPSVPAVVAFEPAPPPSTPAVIPFEPAPDPSTPTVVPFEPAPPTTLPAPIAFEPAPPTPPPAVVVFQDAPGLTLPSPLPVQPAPGPTLPSELPRQPGPAQRQPQATLDKQPSVDTPPPYTSWGAAGQGQQSSNPEVFVKQTANIADSVGVPALVRHAAEQAALFAMNRDGKIWNPLTMIPPPGGGGMVPAAIDALVETHQTKIEQGADRLLALAKGDYTDVQGISSPPFVARSVLAARVGPQNIENLVGPRLVGAASQDTAQVDDILGGKDPSIIGQPLIEASLNSKNLYTSDKPYNSENAGNFFSLGGLVASFTGEGTSTADDDELVKTDQVTGQKKVDIRALYVPRSIRMSSTPMEYRPQKGPPGFAVGKAPPESEKKLHRAIYTSGIVPAKIRGEEDFGFIKTIVNEDPKNKIDDDDALVPVSFMDMRPLAGSNNVRTVYFRPFITTLTEEISPEWNRQNFFGRTDAVVTYMATGRTINLSFLVASMSPEDLETIYQKKNWLASMCYPSYDKDILFKAGPVVRLRVGDLLKTRGGFGLPGIIENLSFDYTDATWELTKGKKVPMWYRVTMGFLVLHETPIGIGVDGQFGGIGQIKDSGQDAGKWKPLESSDGKSNSQNAPEMLGDSISTFSGGPGKSLNDYSKR